MIKHTPTPWRQSKIIKSHLYDNKCELLAVFKKFDNIPFVIHCVNTHDALVEALGHMVEQFIKYTPTLDHEKCWEIIEAKAALAAEKEQE
jgi:hypothetical protein